MPIIAFIIEENALTERSKIETKNMDKLQAFIQEVLKNSNVEWFRDINDLSSKLSIALTKAIQKEQGAYHCTGWVRFQQADTRVNWDEYYSYVYKLYSTIKESETLGGFLFDGIVGITRGGVGVADLFAREFGQNVPIFSLFAYRKDGIAYFDISECSVYNEQTLDLLRKMKIKRILLIDSFTRNGKTIFEAKKYLCDNLSIEAIRTAVVYANSTLSKSTLKQIDYIGSVRNLNGKKLLLSL